MTNAEINIALLDKRGYKQYEGNKDNLSPLMFFFLMDASFQVFSKSIKRQKCSGTQKVFRNRMAEAYRLFYADFYSAFTEDQKDYILDKVDAYEELIEHDLLIAEIAIQECDNSRPLGEQKEQSQTWLCNLLASDAQDFHGECWKTGQRQPLINRYIDQVIKASKEYSRLRFGDGPTLSEKQFKRVQDSVKVLANRTVRFIYDDYLKEIGNGRTNTIDPQPAAAGR